MKKNDNNHNYKLDAQDLNLISQLSIIESAAIELSNRICNEEIKNKKPIKINLGCGDKKLKDYINVDVVDERAGNIPDVQCDIRNLSAFETNFADEVMAIHVVEHFYRWEIESVLKEWIRVLKPGGKLVLECPNLISACEEFLKNPDLSALGGKEGQRSMWVFYGDPAWTDPLMVHRWGYTPNTLATLLHKCGLVELKKEAAQFKLREPRDMRITGIKVR